MLVTLRPCSRFAKASTQQINWKSWSIIQHSLHCNIASIVYVWTAIRSTSHGHYTSTIFIHFARSQEKLRDSQNELLLDLKFVGRSKSYVDLEFVFIRGKDAMFTCSLLNHTELRKSFAGLSLCTYSHISFSATLLCSRIYAEEHTHTSNKAPRSNHQETFVEDRKSQNRPSSSTAGGGGVQDRTECWSRWTSRGAYTTATFED